MPGAGIALVAALAAATSIAKAPPAGVDPGGPAREQERAQQQAQERPVSNRLGAIGGQVVEADSTPVPSVTVRLVGPSPRRTERRTVADAEGRFLFDDLRHGDYRLSIELPGLQAPGDLAVVVLPGQRIETNLVLSLFAYEVEIGVVARSGADPGVLDPDSTAERRELTNRELSRMPLPAEQHLDALPVFPGVVRSADGLISIGGTLPAESAYLFNDADLMDPFTGEYRLRLPLEAVESMSLESGVSSADHGDRLGGVVNVVSAPGGQNWDTEVASPIPRPWIEGGRLRGVRRFTPRLRISGPLAPNATISQAFGLRFSRERVEDTPGGRGDHSVVENWQSLTQLDIRAGERDDLRFILLGSPSHESGTGLSGITPIEATSNTSHSTVALIASNQHRFGPRSFLDSTVQFNRQAAEVRPNQSAPGPAFLIYPDFNDGTAFSNQRRRSHHWQLKSVYNRILGEGEGDHLLQAGFEVHNFGLSGRYENAPVEIYDSDGRLRRSLLSADTPVTLQTGDKWEAALFVQERWRPRPSFWLDVGMRLSHDSAVNSLRFAPRLGVAFDVGGAGTNLIKASIGLVHRRIYLAEQFWDLLPSRLEVTWNEDGSRDVLLLPSRRADRLESPRAVIWNASLTRRLGPRVTARVAYTERYSRKQLVFDRIEGNPIHLLAGEPLPDLAAAPGTGIVLDNSGSADVRQFELTANIRVGQADQLFVTYTRSTAKGDLNDFALVASNRPEPVLHPNAEGPLRFEAPNRLVIWGSFHLPWDLIASPSIEWRDGMPWSSLDAARDYAFSAHDRRFPDYFSPDLQITKGFRIRGVPFRAGLLVTNFVWHSNPRDVIASIDSPRYGEFLNPTPSRIRFRFHASF